MDIVDKLCSSATVFYEYSADNGALLREAANELTKLRAQVASLQETVARYEDVVRASISLVKAYNNFEGYGLGVPTHAVYNSEKALEDLCRSVSDLLNHSSVSITADLYGEIYNENMDKAIDEF